MAKTIKPTDQERLKYRLGLLVKLIEQDAPYVILWSQTDLVLKSFRRTYGTRSWRGTKHQIIASWFRWNFGGKRRLEKDMREEDDNEVSS